MSGRGDNPFNVKLGRIFTPDGTGKFLSLAGRVRRAAIASSSSRGGGRSRRANPEQLFMRRVIVKVNLVRMDGKGQGAQRLHLDYIQRDSASREDSKGYLYDKDGIFTDAESFHEDGKNDRHQFRIIVSPEDSKDMCDLTAFTRDFMNHMERDLETRLSWVAADHYDTAIPHTHIVLRGVRDDGKDLVIPRKYISYGMRSLAEDLVTKELGHIRQMDAAKKIAMMVPQERFTQIDRSFVKMAQVNVQVNVLDMTSGPQDGSEAIWRLNMGRLKRLGKMGLVEKTGWRTWKLDEKFERTLRRMGERGDILKTYHRAMKTAKLQRAVLSDEIYDAYDERAKPIIGWVVEAGITDDVNDRAYMVLDTLSGEALYVDVGSAANIEQIEAGMTIEAKPANITPKPSDYTIDAVADKRRGIYSPAAHMNEDKSARPEFVETHVRRLEAMRRVGHAERNSDGSWKIPHDYLKRAKAFEKSKAYGKPVDVRILSKLPLEKLAQTMGRTWLDEELFNNKDNDQVEGFGEELGAAKNLRRKYLLDKSIIKNMNDPLKQGHLDRLEANDLKQAGEEISRKLSKSFSPMPSKGKVLGTYVRSIDRTSGKYAIIERSKDFTLVPWRDTLERNLGREVMGVVSGDGISWALNKGRDIS